MPPYVRHLVGLVLCIRVICNAQMPSGVNEGCRFEKDSSTGNYVFSWWGDSERTYFIQHSEDLVNWTYVPIIEWKTTPGVTAWSFANPSASLTGFFRLRFTDAPANGNPDSADFDGDGIANAAEIAETGPHTDPLEADSDNDGMPDGWEVSHGLAPLNGDDASDDPDGDGTQSLWEYLLRTNPMVADSNSGDPSLSGGLLFESPVGDAFPLSLSEMQSFASASSASSSYSQILPADWLYIPRSVNYFARSSVTFIDWWYNNWESRQYRYTISGLLTQTSLTATLNSLIPYPWAPPTWAYAWDFGIDGHPYLVGDSGGFVADITQARLWLRLDAPAGAQLLYNAVQSSRHRYRINGAIASSQTKLTYHTFRIDPGYTISTPVDMNHAFWYNITPSMTGHTEEIFTEVVPLNAAQVGWEAKYNNLTSHVDPFSGQMNGLAIFPDASSPSGGLLREVTVRVHVPGYKNRTVYLKVFDVDDPSAINDPQNILDPTDGPNHRAGNDNLTAPGMFPHGYFLPTAARQISMTLNGSGYGAVDFQVTQQPGNNYRIAVALKASDLDFLQVSNSNAAGYVTPNPGQTSGFNGVLTPMLTVWRRLNIEVDSMLGHNGIREAPDRVLAVGANWSNTSSGFWRLNLSTPLIEGNNFYAGGFLQTGGSFGITANDTDSITLNYGLSGGGVTGTVTVSDDDDSGLLSAPLPATNVISDGVKDIYKKAFINIVTLNSAFNPVQSIPFTPYSDHRYPWTNLDDSKNSENYDWTGFWCHYVIVAYQPHSGLDNDPDGSGVSIEGVTGLRNGINVMTDFSAVFVEAIRENPNPTILPTNPQFPANIARRRDEVVAHEIGHMPKRLSGHPETSGLMQDGGLAHDFSAESIRRFRETPSWTASW